MAFVKPHVGAAEGRGPIVVAGDLSGSLTSLTIESLGLKDLAIMCDVTRPAAGVTAVQMFADYSNDGTTWYPVMDLEETATPVKVLVAEQYDKAIAGTGTTLWALQIPAMGVFMRLRFTETAGAAGDLLDVEAYGRG